MTEPEITVRPAVSADTGPLSAAMARSFYDDPVLAWMIPQQGGRLARAQRAFATVLRTGALRRRGVEVALSDGIIVGGAIWYPPGDWVPGVLEQLRSVPGYMLALGRRIGPCSALVQSLARAHPHEPQWYLYSIGVDPAFQGRGIGGALLRSRLRRCDDAGEPAYLESSKPGNVPLYEHFGFAATGTPKLPGGAPAVTTMWRAGRP